MRQLERIVLTVLLCSMTIGNWLGNMRQTGELAQEIFLWNLLRLILVVVAELIVVLMLYSYIDSEEKKRGL